MDGHLAAGIGKVGGSPLKRVAFNVVYFSDTVSPCSTCMLVRVIGAVHPCKCFGKSRLRIFRAR